MDYISELVIKISLPTAIKSERIFLSAVSLGTKLRSRISDFRWFGYVPNIFSLQRKNIHFVISICTLHNNLFIIFLNRK